MASNGSTNASPKISVPAVRRSNCIASNYIPRQLAHFALARLDTYGSGRIVGNSENGQDDNWPAIAIPGESAGVRQNPLAGSL